ncbi:hypothetical protein, partial [Sulfitobacter pontiacus]|uniref:hypothetical protein n=1 Tax=Sulfitobacter pontiacus TaxID=60137 RepID=UPI003296AEFE
TGRGGGFDRGRDGQGGCQAVELIPSTVPDGRRMVRPGKLVLPNLDGMDFVPVEIEATVPVAQASPTIFCGTLDVVKGDVTLRLDTTTPATRIAEIVQALAP